MIYILFCSQDLFPCGRVDEYMLFYCDCNWRIAFVLDTGWYLPVLSSDYWTFLGVGMFGFEFQISVSYG